MSNTGTSNYDHPPSNPTECRDEGGYKACFYPGFVRRLALRAADGTEKLIYEQQGSFVLPPGYDQPWPSSTLEYSDPTGRRMLLQVYDPGHEIDRIEIRFKSPQALARRQAQLSGSVAGESTGAGAEVSLGAEGEEEPSDVLVVENVAILCPPICPD